MDTGSLNNYVVSVILDFKTQFFEFLWCVMDTDILGLWVILLLVY